MNTKVFVNKFCILNRKEHFVIIFVALRNREVTTKISSMKCRH